MENVSNLSRPCDSYDIFAETIESGLTRPLVLLVQCIILLIGTVGNLLVLILIIKYKKLQTLSNSFVVALACADLDNCLLISCLHLAVIVDPYVVNDNSFICIFMTLEPIAMTSLSFLSLASLTTERFIAVYFPFEHLRWVNKRSVGVTITLSAIYALLVGFSPVFIMPHPISFFVQSTKSQYMEYSTAANLFIFYGVWIPAILVILISYGLISRAALKQAKKLPTFKNKGIRVRGNKLAVSVIKSVKVFIIIALGMTLIWVPYILFTTIFILHPNASEMVWLPLIIIILTNLGRGISAANPWIFVLRNKTFFECLKQLFSPRKNTVSQKTMMSQTRT